MDSSRSSTLGPWIWYNSIILKLLKCLKAIKHLQTFSKFEILDNFIQPHPEFQGIPTLVHPRVGDNNFFYLKLLILTKPFKEKKKFQIQINTF